MGKISLRHMASVSLLLGVMLACEVQDDTSRDLVRRVESAGLALVCRTNEPFALIGFNYYGDGDGAAPYGNGDVYFTYPNNTPPDFTGKEVLKRIGGAYDPASGNTGFELSQGMTGYIEETPGGACVDDMAGTPHNYRITIENWGADAVDGSVKTGCCTAENPRAR